jgi:hypothetical protein
MSKFVFKAIAAAALVVTGASSFAQVTISANPAVPVTFAREITGTAPITLTNVGGALSLVTSLNYTMSPGEVRSVRLELPTGNTFAAGSTVTVNNGGTAGAINGLGTNVITFPITAPAGGLVATTTITVDGNRTITNTAANVTAEYGLYDAPASAVNKNTTFRITSVGPAAYINFAASQVVNATPLSQVADVASTGSAFTRFVAGNGISGVTNVVANLGTLDYRLVTLAGTVSTNPVPFTIAGAPVTLTNLNATGANGTKLAITGDFTGAANADGTFTGAALGRVFLAPDAGCAVVSVAASAVTATTATFNVGDVATTPNPALCYAPRAANGSTVAPIVASAYSASLNTVAASAAYTLTNIAAAVGSITRNGTELQAPLFQTTPGYVSRFVLTNTSAVDGNYTIVVRGESGAVLGTANLTGVIPANSMRVFNSSDILTSVTGGVGNGAPRAFAVITVDRPTNTIQGMYQVVNPTSGAVSQTPLLRPGTN